MPPSRRCQFPVSGSPPTLSKYRPVAPLRLPHSVQLISTSFVLQSTFHHFPTPHFCCTFTRRTRRHSSGALRAISSRRIINPVSALCRPGQLSQHSGLLWVGRSGDRIPVWVSRPALGTTQPPVQWVRNLFPGGKSAGTWRWPPIPCSA
jgi:hypothetical protein